MSSRPLEFPTLPFKRFLIELSFQFSAPIVPPAITTPHHTNAPEKVPKGARYNFMEPSSLYNVDEKTII